MMLSKMTLAALGLILLATSGPGLPLPARLGPNLLVNGGFEEGPEVGEFLPLNPGDTRIKGWVVTRGQIDLVAATWQAAEGKRSLDLHGSPSFGGVAQTFATQPKHEYLVTFMASRSPGIEGEFGIIIEAAGKQDSFLIPDRGATKDNMQWGRYSFAFIANSDKTTLEIRTIGRGNPVAGPTLDDVVVVEK